MAPGNLGQFQIERMRRYGDSVALIDARTKHCFTYKELIERVQRLAAGLHVMGLKKGDVTCVVTNNHIDYHVIWYAVNLIGGTLQTAAPSYTDDDLIWRFQECQTRFLITTEDQVPRIKRIAEHLKLRSPVDPGLLQQIIVYGSTAEGCVAFDRLLGHGSVKVPTYIDPRADNSLLLSSSGTTGLPKHVKLTHDNITSSLPIIQEVYQHVPGMVAIVTVPVFHHYGLHSCVGAGLYNGLKMVIMEKYDTETLLNLIQEYKPDILNIVPPIAVRLVKHPGIRDLDLSSVTCITSAAAPFGPEVEKQLMEIFGISYLAQTYGCTETGRTAGNKPSAYKLGSCGVIPSGVRIKIVDPASGRQQPAGVTGEILVAGSQVTPGYLNRPDVTQEAFDKHGFFKTGDLGYLDEDGFLFVVDRLKELIKYKGLQVAPAYLEDLLRKHPDIADAAVVGVADAEAGELPRAFVVMRAGASLTEAQVVQFVRDHVSPHMRLRGGAEFIQQVPRTASGKILRRLLRDRSDKSKL